MAEEATRRLGDGRRETGVWRGYGVFFLPCFISRLASVKDLIMHLRPRTAGVGDAGADLDCFYSVDGHDRASYTAVKFVFPGCVRPETDGQVFRDHLENSA